MIRRPGMVPSRRVCVPVVICCEQDDRDVWDSRNGVAEDSRLRGCYALLNGE